MEGLGHSTSFSTPSPPAGLCLPLCFQHRLAANGDTSSLFATTPRIPLATIASGQTYMHRSSHTHNHLNTDISCHCNTSLLSQAYKSAGHQHGRPSELNRFVPCINSSSVPLSGVIRSLGQPSARLRSVVFRRRYVYLDMTGDCGGATLGKSV